MDVNWYTTEKIVHQRLAELRASVARCRCVEGPGHRWTAALGPALVRVRHRLLAGLGAARVVAGRRLG